MNNLLASRNTKLAIAALQMIATGLGILTLLALSGMIELTKITIKAIALGIKLLNEWCDAQSRLLFETGHAECLTISGVEVMRFQTAKPRLLITPAILPSSGNVIAIAPREISKPNFATAKKRGRPKKLAVGFA